MNKRFLIASLLTMGTLFMPLVASAEVGTFTGVGSYDKSIYDDLYLAEVRSVEAATEHAIGQAGVYFENYTKSENAQVSIDELQAIASKKIKVIGNPKITRTKLPTGTIRIDAEITATVDTADVDDVLAENAERRRYRGEQYQRMKQLKESLDNNIVELKNRILKLQNMNNDNDFDITDEQERQRRISLAWDKLDSDNDALYDDKKMCLYNEALLLNPKYSEAYFSRGNVYFENGDFIRAITDYSQALILNTNFASAYYNRGNAYNCIGDNDRAIADFNQALTLDQNMIDLYIVRGFAYENKGDYERALSDYSKYITMNYVEKMNPDWLDSPMPEVYINRGLLYSTMGEYDLAIADFNQFLTLEHDNDFTPAAAYYDRGIAYYKKGDYDQAISDFKKALELYPDHSLAKEQLQFVYEKKKNNGK